MRLKTFLKALLIVVVLVAFEYCDYIGVSKYVLSVLPNDGTRSAIAPLFPVIKKIAYYVGGVVAAMGGKILETFVSDSRDERNRAPNVGFSNPRLSISRNSRPADCGEVVALTNSPVASYVVCELENYGDSFAHNPTIQDQQLRCSVLGPADCSDPAHKVTVAFRMDTPTGPRKKKTCKVWVSIQNQNNELYEATYKLKVDVRRRNAVLVRKSGFRRA